MSKGTKGLDRKQAQHLAKTLRALMTERYPTLSDTEVAKQIGVPQSQLSSALRGENRGFGVQGLIRIRDHFRVSIDDLLGLSTLPRRALPPEIEDAVWEAIERARPTPPAPTLPPKRDPKKKPD